MTKPKPQSKVGLTERRRVQLRERFLELWRHDSSGFVQPTNSRPHVYLTVEESKEAAWRIFLAGMTDKSTPAKRRNRFEEAEAGHNQ